MERSGARKRSERQQPPDPFEIAESTDKGVQHSDVPKAEIPSASEQIESTSKPKVSDGEKAKNQIAKYLKSNDFGRARAVARKAVDEGILTDEDIERTIEENSPSVEDAEKLPGHRMLAWAAASGKRRNDYAPALSVTFSDESMGKLTPDQQKQLRAHLKALGIGGTNQ